MTTDNHSHSERSITFGSLTMAGQPLTPQGSWVLTERHGASTTSFIVMDDDEARAVARQITERLGGQQDTEQSS